MSQFQHASCTYIQYCPCSQHITCMYMYIIVRHWIQVTTFYRKPRALGLWFPDSWATGRVLLKSPRFSAEHIVIMDAASNIEECVHIATKYFSFRLTVFLYCKNGVLSALTLGLMNWLDTAIADDLVRLLSVGSVNNNTSIDSTHSNQELLKPISWFICHLCCVAFAFSTHFRSFKKSPCPSLSPTHTYKYLIPIVSIYQIVLLCYNMHV